MKTESEILKRLENIRNLPTLPAVIDKLRSATSDSRSDAKRIASIIEDDPSMMARIMKVVNSVFFGGVEPITSVEHAIARMGFNAVNNIAMSTSVFSTFESSDSDSFNREAFWRHCISTGIAADVLYDMTKNNLRIKQRQDLLHLAGLLHDIGKIIFEQYFHDEFIESLKDSIDRKVPLCISEVDTVGTDHTLVGAWLGEKWNLSDNIIEAIKWHHDPEKASPEHRELVILCHCANYICNIEQIGESGDSSAPVFMPEIWKTLGVQPEEIPGVVETIRVREAESEILMSFV